jgi:hypothetical protein
MHRALLLFVFLSLALGGCAGRQPPVHFNVMLGYAHTELEESGGFEPILDDRDGARVAVGADVPTMGTSVNGSGLRLGGRMSVSWLRDNQGERFLDDEPLLVVEDFIDLTMFTPQVVASYRQVIGDPDAGAAFIEPGVGLGLAVATMSFGSDLEFGDDLVGTDIQDRERDVGFAVSPFLRGGFTRGRYLIGLESGYEWTSISFDHDLGDDPTQWYLGIFLSVELGEEGR